MNASPQPSGVGPPPAAGAAEHRLDPVDRALLAHDLRGALHGIMGGLTVIDREGLPRDTREQLDRVFAATEQVVCLLYLLLGDLPEGFDPTLGLEFQSVEVSRLLDFLRRRWTAEARRKGLSLRIVAEADAPTRVEVGLLSLGRMMENLVGNAVSHCVEGGIELVASATRGGGLRLRLSDTGPGIAEETLRRARAGLAAEDVDPDRVVHGLGLHVVRRLADQIGAELTLANRPGGGFEALIEFPPEKCARCDPAAPGPGADLAGARILLAEDNLTNQMVATQMLRALHAEVTVTSDGAEALAAFEAEEFDLLVLDIEMPRVSGLDVIRRVRARSDARAGVPIVALTAYALREHQERIAKAGANGLISKPIAGIEALGRALAAYLPPGFRNRAAKTPDTKAPVVDPVVYAALAQSIGEELMSELIEKVAADLGAARAELEAARAPRDGRAIRSASHILISVAGAIGAIELQSLARKLNAAAHTDEEGPLDAEVVDCVAEIDAVLAFLAGVR